MIPRAVFGPSTAIMSMKGMQVPVVWIVALGFVVAAALCFALFPLFEVAGFAIAYLVACTFVCALQWWWAVRKTGIDTSIFASLPVIAARLSVHLRKPQLPAMPGSMSADKTT